MRSTVLWSLVLYLSACATAPVAREIDRSATISADFASVWDATIDVFGDQNWPIGSLERESGIITTDWMLISSEYMDCGSPGFGNSHREHQVRFNVVVREANTASTLTVTTSMQAEHVDAVNGVSRGLIRCESLGTLERTLHEMVTDRTVS